MRTRRRCNATLPAIGATLLIAVPAAGQPWDVEYDAGSLVFPENSGTGWSYYDNGGGLFQRGFVGNTLWVDTMPPGSPTNALDWFNSTGRFDFAGGFVMEARLKLVRATSVYGQRWGGAMIYARSDDGYNMDIQVATDHVNIGSIYDYVSYPMITTDVAHTYRAEAYNDRGLLFIDGVLRLVLPLQRDNPIRGLYFGDQGWEGGEMDYDYVRYGVPEPTSVAVVMSAAALAPALLRRTRRP